MARCATGGLAAEQACGGRGRHLVLVTITNRSSVPIRKRTCGSICACCTFGTTYSRSKSGLPANPSHVADINPDLRGKVSVVRIREVYVFGLVMTITAPGFIASRDQHSWQLFVFHFTASAWSAISALSAATNATRSPTKRTLLSKEKLSNGPGMGSD